MLIKLAESDESECKQLFEEIKKPLMKLKVRFIFFMFDLEIFNKFRFIAVGLFYINNLSNSQMIMVLFYVIMSLLV